MATLTTDPQRRRSEPLPGPQLVLLDALTVERDLQLRVDINEERVCYFQEQMAAGIVFPPVVAFWDRTELWLSDGFHRYLAVKRRKELQLWVDVHLGTVQDALVWAYRANATHGEPLRATERRAALRRIVAECREPSARVLADRLGVGHATVSRIRAELRAEAKDARVREAAARQVARQAPTVSVETVGAPVTAEPVPVVRHTGADGRQRRERAEVPHPKGSRWLSPEQKAYYAAMKMLPLTLLDPDLVAQTPKAESLAASAAELHRASAWIEALALALDARLRQPVRALAERAQLAPDGPRPAILREGML